MRNTTFLVATLSMFFACRSNNEQPVDATSGDGGGGSGGFVTIQQVQSSSMPPGTPVSLQGVIVTAVDAFGTRQGDIWVEEPGGGPFSGVLIFPPAALQATAVALQVGDIITLTGGEKDDFALTGSNADPTGRTDTEVEQISGGKMAITVTGQGTAPAPQTIDLTAIGKLYDPAQGSAGGGAAFTAAWQMWEGVLVTATNVDAFGAPKTFGSGGADQYDLDISGDGELEGSLTDITMSGIKVDTCLATLTGVVDYFYNFLIYPRSSSDIATGGASCVFENAANGSAYCTDGIDNDGNGFTDCADLGCEVGSNAYVGTSCVGTGTATCGCSTNYATNGISSTNTANATTSGPVSMGTVYVTGVNTGSSRGYWVSDSMAAQAGHGGFVFTSSTPPASIVVGAELATLQGLAGPFPTSGTGAKLVEIEDATAGTITTGPTVAPITNASVATLADLTAGATYVNTLVTVGPVTAGALGAHNQITLTSGANTLTMDDDADFGYGFGSGLGSGSDVPPSGCITVTGVLELNTTDNIHTLNPRGSADIATATGCN
ncbi:MAG TPA: hypothetical protein VH143_23155 [Kofleriaceae bacterium]|jgi:hypothetical protein|nr:hypothetical protein [Kofleriaceae bacterium]